MREDVAAIVAKLTAAQRTRLLSFRAEPKQMGIGMMQFLPGCVEPVGADHPIFGPHYRLTPRGLALCEALQQGGSDGRDC